MYLIIGNEQEPCAHAVKSALERQQRTVVVDANPLGTNGWLRWQFDTLSTTIEYSVGDSRDSHRVLEGVFVRHYTGLQDAGGWTPDDLSYLQSEGMAAMLAWLHALDCPVVGRANEDAWYRPRRPLPEWVSVLAACGLPTPRVMITNVPDAERHERQWSGSAIYQPATSTRRYRIDSSGWTELARIMQSVPVCLTEPDDAPGGAVTLACGRTFWSEPDLPGHDALDSGVRRVAERIGTDFVQLVYANGSAGIRFSGINVAPIVELHNGDDQLAIAECIARALTGAAGFRLRADDGKTGSRTFAAVSVERPGVPS